MHKALQRWGWEKGRERGGARLYHAMEKLSQIGEKILCKNDSF